MTEKDKTRIINDECLALSNQLSGTSCSERMGYSTGYFTRQVFTAHTIWRTAYPVQTQEFVALGTRTFQDFQSCYVLLRSMYETCVQVRYLLLDARFTMISNVIFHVTGLHSLRERHKLGKSLGSQLPAFQHIAQKLEERKELIIGHSEFLDISESIRNWVNASHEANRGWDNMDFEKKAKSAGFHKTWHYQYNKYFSNYVHCDPLAIEQINAVRESNDARAMMDVALRQLQNFICHALNTHAQVCKSEEVNVRLSEMAINTIAIWEHINKADFSQDRLK